MKLPTPESHVSENPAHPRRASTALVHAAEAPRRLRAAAAERLRPPGA